MFFKVVSIVMLIMVSIAIPPLLIVSVPYALAQFGIVGAKGAKMHRQQSAFIAYQTDQNFLRDCRSL